MGGTVATVHQWSASEIRALRDAKRMSIRDFAAHLGVSDRMISKWEAGAVPRPINQASLDICLARCDPDVQARFAHLSAATGGTSDDHAPLGEIATDTDVRHPTDGKSMVKVEGSVALIGPQNEPVWLTTFYVDRHPVTNAEYARFVAASGHPPPQHWSDGHHPRGLDDHPVVFVTWNDADAYARWAGKTLPTSQQWEKAARGTRGYAYPWGDQPTPAKCNVRENGVNATTPGDRYQSGISPYGVYDMCGNVWEWCSDATEPDRRELKGGAWTSPFSRAAPASFNDASVKMCDDDTGFRCVAPAETFEGAGGR